MDQATHKLGETAKFTGDQATKSGGLLKSAFSTGIGFAGATVGLQAIGGAVRGLTGGFVGMNATLETSTLQFESLFRDADRARDHVASLFRFAAETPFETGPIIEASRLLETFGASGEKNLRLVGDAAAATNQGIEEVGFWFGRAYSAIQAGRPFGESAARLQEMGILTGTARQRLEDLQEQGASTDEVWAELTGSFSRFDGAMIKQAGTFKGLTSTISDNVNLIAAAIGRPFFDRILKPGLGRLASFLSSPAVNKAAEGLAKLLDRTITRIGEGFKFLTSESGPLNVFVTRLALALGVPRGSEQLIGFTSTLGALFGRLAEIGRNFVGVFRGVTHETTIFVDEMDGLPPTLRLVATILRIGALVLVAFAKEMQKTIGFVVDLGKELLTLADGAIKRINDALGFTNGQLSPLSLSIEKLGFDLIPALGKALAGVVIFQFARQVGEAAFETAKLAKQIATFPLRTLEGMRKAITDFGSAATTAAGKVASFTSKLADLASSATGFVGKAASSLAGLGVNAAQNVTQTITQVVSRSAEVTRQLTEDIADRTQKITQEIVDVTQPKAAVATSAGKTLAANVAKGFAQGLGVALAGAMAAVVGAGLVAAGVGIGTAALILAGVIAVAVGGALLITFRREIGNALVSAIKELPEFIGRAAATVGFAALLAIAAPIIAGKFVIEKLVIPVGNAIINGIISGITAAAAAIPGIFSGIVSTIGATLSSLPSIGLSIGTSFVNALVSAVTALPGIIGDAITGFWRSQVEGWNQILSGDFVGGLNSIFVGVPGIIIEALSALPGAVVELFNGMIAAVIGTFNGLVEAVSGVLNSIVETVLAWPIVAAVVKIGRDIYDGFVDQLNLLNEKVAEIIGVDILKELGKLVDFVIGIPDMLAGTVEDLIKQFKKIGADLVDGLLGGITDRIGEKLDDLTKPFEAIPKKVKDFFKSFSPSLVMYEIGEDVAEGFVDGITERVKSMTPEVERAVSGLVVGGIHNNRAFAGLDRAGMLRLPTAAEINAAIAQVERTAVPAARQAGVSTGNALAAGITSTTSAVVTAFRNIGTAAAQAFNERIEAARLANAISREDIIANGGSRPGTTTTTTTVSRTSAAGIRPTGLVTTTTGGIGAVGTGGTSTSGFQHGTDWAHGGINLVGERGRELVALPPAASVLNNRNTERLFSMFRMLSSRQSPAIFRANQNASFNAVFNVSGQTIEEQHRNTIRAVDEYYRAQRFRAVNQGALVSGVVG